MAKKIFLFLFFGCMAISAFAKVFIIETDDATIYATNSATVWTPDVEKRQSRLEGIANNKFNYTYILNGEKVTAASGLNYSRIENQLTPIIEEPLLVKGKSVSRTGAFGVGLKDEVSVSPADMSKFVSAQDALFKLLVIKQGNPLYLEDRVKGNKLLGNVLGLITLGFAIDKMGLSSGFNTVGSSGLGQSIASLPREISKDTVSAVYGIPNGEQWSKYHAIDVFYGPSQVIIAYKGSKTTDIHDRSLALAINKMLDVSKEEITQYWAEDFAYRQKVWADCKSTGDAACQD